MSHPHPETKSEQYDRERGERAVELLRRLVDSWTFELNSYQRTLLREEITDFVRGNKR